MRGGETPIVLAHVLRVARHYRQVVQAPISPAHGCEFRRQAKRQTPTFLRSHSTHLGQPLSVGNFGLKVQSVCRRLDPGRSYGLAACILCNLHPVRVGRNGALTSLKLGGSPTLVHDRTEYVVSITHFRQWQMFPRRSSDETGASSLSNELQFVRLRPRFYLVVSAPTSSVSALSEQRNSSVQRH